MSESQRCASGNLDIIFKKLQTKSHIWLPSCVFIVKAFLDEVTFLIASA